MIKKVFVLFGGSLHSQIFSFISGLIVIKMLSLEQYGVFAILTTFISIITIPASRFFSLSIKRFVPMYIKRKQIEYLHGLIKVSLFYSIFLSLIFSLILILSSNFIVINLLKLDEKYLWAFILYSTSIIVFSLYTVFSNLLLGLEKFYKYTYSVNIIPNSLRLIYLLTWWIFLPYKLLGAITSIIIKNISTSLISLWFLKDELYIIKNSRPRYKLKEWVYFSFPYFMKYFVNYIAQNISVIFLGNFKNVISAGIFRIANFPITAILNLSIAFSGVILPKISGEVAVKNYKNIELILRKATVRNFTITSILIITTLILSKFFLIYLGKEYLKAYPIIVIMSYMLVLESWSYLCQDVIIAYGKTTWILITHIFASFISIYASYILIPEFGLTGAAIAIVLESLIAFIFRLAWVIKLGIDIRSVINAYTLLLFIFMILTLNFFLFYFSPSVSI